MFFKKKPAKKLYRVTYHEIDTTDYTTEVMDGQTLGYLSTDWAFVVDKVEVVD